MNHLINDCKLSIYPIVNILLSASQQQQKYEQCLSNMLPVVWKRVKKGEEREEERDSALYNPSVILELFYLHPWTDSEFNPV